MMRAGIGIGGLFLMLCLAAPAAAQDFAPPGWTPVKTDGAIVYKNPAASDELVMLLGPMQRNHPSIDKEITALADGIGASFGCGAYDASGLTLTADRTGALLRFRGGCAIAAQQVPENMVRVAIVRGDLTGRSRDVFVRALGWVGAGNGGEALAAASATDSRQPILATPEGDAALKAALAAVPAEARPVHVALHGFNSSSGWPPSNRWVVVNYLMFGNGWATRCADWDPSKLRPTPESLGRAYPDCGLMRWRRNGDSIQLQGEDGKWDSAVALDPELRAFKPGERFDLAFGNLSGTGFSGAGMVAVSALRGGDLRMASDGRIAVGEWSDVVLSGQNVAGNSNRRDAPKTGQYRIDGNLIAVRDASGAISIGFITGTPGQGRLDHLYLNGTHFWKGDD